MSYTAAEVIARRRELWAEYQDPARDAQFVQAVAEYLVDRVRGKDLRREIHQDPELLVEMCMVIVDKEAKTVPLFLNDVQQEIRRQLAVEVERYRQGKRNHLRFILLKARQQGCTAYITARQLAYSIVRSNFFGFTLTDKSDNTETIFSSKAKFPYDRLPECLKPTERYNNRRELHFEKLNSKWRAATAGGATMARGDTLGFWHGSEVAYWPNTEKAISDIMPAVTAGTVVIFESTANGENEFKKLWDSGNYTTMFFPWWLSSEYRMSFPGDMERQAFRAEVKRARGIQRAGEGRPEWVWERIVFLLDEVGLTEEQAYWYYDKWQVHGETVKQEYPCSADEAFLASGRPVFNRELLSQRKMRLELVEQELAREGKRRYREGFMELRYEDPEGRSKPRGWGFKDAEGGFVKVYAEPEKDTPYVLGGDTRGDGSDYFTLSVRNNITWEQVATLHGRMDDITYVEQAYALGRWYNDALIGVEVNFNTYPVTELQRLNYPRQAVRQVYDKIKDGYVDRYGFKTDGNTRPLIISKMQTCIKDYSHLINDMTLLKEAMAFAYDDNGRPDAPSGAHDDMLFADMIALEIRGQQGMQKVEHSGRRPKKLIERLDKQGFRRAQ